MSLKTQDQRFMLSPDGQSGNWFHLLEIEKRCPGWTDCTDMSDELFQHVVMDRLWATRLAAAGAQLAAA